MRVVVSRAIAACSRDVRYLRASPACLSERSSLSTSTPMRMPGASATPTRATPRVFETLKSMSARPCRRGRPRSPRSIGTRAGGTPSRCARIQRSAARPRDVALREARAADSAAARARSAGDSHAGKQRQRVRVIVEDRTTTA